MADSTSYASEVNEPRRPPQPGMAMVGVAVGSAASGGLDDLDHYQGGGGDQVAAQGEQPRSAQRRHHRPLQGGQRGGAPRRAVLVGEGFAFVAGQSSGG